LTTIANYEKAKEVVVETNTKRNKMNDDAKLQKMH